jgi:hypothetical protein
MLTDEILNKVYLKRCGKLIKQYYTEEFKAIKTPVYKLNKPIMYDDKINLCPQLKPSKPYKNFDNTTKKKVNIYLDYIKEVLASNSEEVYQYLLKWTANMCKGNKNDSALVFKTTAKGVGKSTHPTMLRKYILGESLSLETGSDPLKNKFNSILGGKLLVYFEELETFTSSEWVAVSSVLKRQITSDTITLQKKGQDTFEAENINNYILLSNHDVDDDGRRFFVADINTIREGDVKYWDNLASNCYNEEVGYALYCYFLEIDTTHFKPQQFPITKNKLNSISKRLDSVYLFLKEKYILENKSIYEKLSDLYTNYKLFCELNIKKKPCGKTDFITKLSEIQINFYKTNGFNMYKVDLDKLKLISSKKNWINQYDEYEKDDEDTDEDDKDYFKLYQQLLKENSELKKKLNI